MPKILFQSPAQAELDRLNGNMEDIAHLSNAIRRSERMLE